MKLTNNLFRHVRHSLTCAALLFSVSAFASSAKPDGNWTWTTPARNGGAERTTTLTLKSEGNKLTGKVSAPGRDGQAAETNITDGKIEGETITFNVVREFNGNSVTAKYSGKVEADKITGKIENTREGQNQSREWQAKRATETK